MKVTLPGQIRSHQGINVPGAGLSVATLTEKDLADLEWTRKHDVAYVGLSFVRTAGDIRRLREELDRRGSKAKIIAKIEKPQAVANLQAIVAETDAVMIARGDLGVELDVTRVPEIQKRIIETCRRCRVPVITATQMLGSMELSSRPTRAEASDVYNAVLDGTDAVMLSGETAIGTYPVESVAMMSRIVGEAERRLFEKRRTNAEFSAPLASGPDPESTGTASTQVARAGLVRPITDSVVAAASMIAEQLGAALIVVETHSGRTATALSNQRGGTMVLALGERDAYRSFDVAAVGRRVRADAERGRARRAARIRREMGPRPRLDRPGRADCPHPGVRSGGPHSQRARGLRSRPDVRCAGSQSCRMNATRSVFSSLVSFSPKTRLKNSAVSSSVRHRPSCRYGGLSLMPRSVKVLIGPVGDSATNSSVLRSCNRLSR